MPSDDKFKDELVIESQFEASGYIGREYDVAWMYVGLIQLGDPDADGDREITAGAYGMGLPALADHDTTRQEWKLMLQRDSEHPNLSPGKATGFVLAQVRGGKITGWIHEGIALVDP